METGICCFIWVKSKCMKKLVITIFTCLLFTVSLYSQSPVPQTKKQPNISQQTTTNKSNETQVSTIPKKVVPLTRQQLSQLKAVLVVGPLNSETATAIEDMKGIASYLRDSGVIVFEFYYKEAIWADIVKASEGAHIFIYQGHGTNKGDSGRVGGLVLTADKNLPKYTIVPGSMLAKINGFVETRDIESELKLHKNALVIFKSVCFATGSSASDFDEISLELAQKRVCEYSLPFTRIGAGATLAINYIQCWPVIFVLQSFFKGDKLQNNYMNGSADVEQLPLTTYPFNPKYIYSVSCKQFLSIKKFTSSLVCLPDFSIYDLLK